MDFSFLPRYDVSAGRTPAGNPPAYNSGNAPVSVLNADPVQYDLSQKPNFLPAYNPAAAPVTILNSQPRQGPPVGPPMGVPAYRGPGDGSALDPIMPALSAELTPGRAPGTLGNIGPMTDQLQAQRDAAMKMPFLRSIGASVAMLPTAFANTARSVYDPVSGAISHVVGELAAGARGEMPKPAGVTADPVAAVAANPNITMLKSKVVPMEQAMARMNPAMQAGQAGTVDPEASTGIPLGSLMKLAAVANQRKVISAKDQLLQNVYGWHRADYLNAKDAMEKETDPVKKAAHGVRMSKAMDKLDAIASPQGFIGSQIYGQQQPAD